ncbi:CHAD domain-containing protein [Povalibacter sp.]|uniref:CHAD domain-containing protein n=1 Tax=Povalibacter sp. TaxID=1962978 RepID=UPI002F42B6AF
MHAYRQHVESAVRALLRPDALDHEAVHETRKNLKRARAALGLLRTGLPTANYKSQKHGIRKLASSLAKARDAKVVSDTLEHLLREQHVHVNAGVRGLRQALLNERDRVPDGLSRDLVSLGRDLMRAADGIARSDTNLRPRDLLRGMRRTCRRTGRDMKLASRKRTAATLHRWRRRVQCLKYQLDVLPAGSRLQRRVHRISELLGVDHDLWMLRQAIRKFRRGYPEDSLAGDLDPLARSIRRRRRRLQARAFEIGKDTFGRRARPQP